MAFSSQFLPGEAIKGSHGLCPRGKKSRVYEAWTQLRSRCLNPKHRQFHRYGGRGITVCDRWQGPNGFVNFLEDMGHPPDGMSLDRERNDDGYHPGNCRWATSKTQARNRRSNRLIEYRGRSMTIAEWSEELGVSPVSLGRRLLMGWTVEKAIETPINKNLSRSK